MKVFLPSHIPLKYVFPCVLGLLMLELLEGTTPMLALTAQAFVVISAVAFNAAGGFLYPSGGFIFFNATLSLIIGLVSKAYLGEPLQSNLLNPQRTLLIYLAGMCALLVAVLVNGRLRLKRPLLSRRQIKASPAQIALGCLIIAVAVPFVLPGSLQGTFSQFNSGFVMLSILIPVYFRVKETDGKSSFSVVALLAWVYLTGYYGLYGFSKQGLFGASAAWALAALAGGYRLSLKRAVVIGVAGTAFAVILTPYSQVGRNYRNEANVIDIGIDLLSHPLRTRQLYLQSQADELRAGGTYHWFDKPLSLFDRLTLVPIDDALIYSTDHVGSGPPAAVWSYFTNMIPRFLYPDKPYIVWGNVYAKEIGVIDQEDFFTGISFTPYSDAYHTTGWLGVTLILGGMFFMMFWVCDSVAGSLADSQWTLVYLLWFAHSGAEGMLGVATYTMSNTTAALIAAALISTRLAPAIGGFFIVDRPALSRAWTVPARR